MNWSIKNRHIFDCILKPCKHGSCLRWVAASCIQHLGPNWCRANLPPVVHLGRNWSHCNDNSIGDADTSLNSKVLSCLAVNQIEGFFRYNHLHGHSHSFLQKKHLQATVQFKNGCDEVCIALHTIQHKLEGASQWCAFLSEIVWVVMQIEWPAPRVNFWVEAQS